MWFHDRFANLRPRRCHRFHLSICPMKMCCVFDYVMRQRHATLPLLLTIPWQHMNKYISLRPLNICNAFCLYILYTCSCQIDRNNFFFSNQNRLDGKTRINWSHNTHNSYAFSRHREWTKLNRIKSNRNESTHKDFF